MAKMTKEEEKVWRKERYKRMSLDVDRELAEEFLEILKLDGIKFQKWAKEQIRSYVTARKKEDGKHVD
jgi:hypothetical protein